MKKLSLIYLVFLLVSCGTATITNQHPEGVYTCTFEHEFAKTEDTILLQRANENYFKIIRHSGVTSKENGNKKILKEVWKLEYEGSKKVFTELKKGRKVFWEADRDLLVFGNRNYVKLKN
jgi:hypothetical protein